jgi:hypothetical protein
MNSKFEFGILFHFQKKYYTKVYLISDIRLIQLSTRAFRDYSVVKFLSEIQIMHQGIWGHVAGEKWTMENAQVICRELNKPGVKSFQLLKTDISSEDRIMWLKDVRCKGDEKRLLDCPRGTWLERKNETVSNWKVVLECIPGNSLLGTTWHQNFLNTVS